MGEQNLLLGKDFRNQVVKDTEAKAKVTNAVRRKKKRNRPASAAASSADRSFRNSPPRRASFNKGASGGQRTPKFVYQKKEKSYNKKGQCDHMSFFQKSGISSPGAKLRSKSRPSLCKRVVSRVKNTSDPIRRKVKTLPGFLGEVDKRPKHIGHYKRVSNTIQKAPSSKVNKR